MTPPTVKEQLGTRWVTHAAYITPDTVADFTTIQLEREAEDRVRVVGVHGDRAHGNAQGEHRLHRRLQGSRDAVYAWPDAVEKAQLADRVLRASGWTGSASGSTKFLPSTWAGTRRTVHLPAPCRATCRK